MALVTILKKDGEHEHKQAEETITTPDGLTIIPTYVPTIEETVKASGGHRQAGLFNIIDPQA